MRLVVLAIFGACSSTGGDAPVDGAVPDAPGPSCGNGACDSSETGCNCPTDCAATCGDGCCGATETSCECAIDCGGTCCGNAVCESGEDTASCVMDCPAPFCGDGLCLSDEDCSSCATDCPCSAVQACSSGSCTSCGNGVCDSGLATPRIVLDVDTSFSMGSDVCGSMEADETLECPGLDVPCIDCDVPGCDNGLPDDSRLWKIKTALTSIVSAHPNLEFALARAHMETEVFSCVQGGWRGPAPFCSNVPIGTGQNSAAIVADFDEPHASLLEWFDGQDNYAGAPPPTGCNLCSGCEGGCDKELRANGFRPHAGGLYSIRSHLNDVRATDPLSHCRPHTAILVTSGGNYCRDPEFPDDPDPTPEQAAALCATGVPVYVVALGNVELHDALDETAAAGCAPSCNATGCDGLLRVVDSEAALAIEVQAILAAQVAVNCSEDVSNCAADCP